MEVFWVLLQDRQEGQSSSANAEGILFPFVFKLGCVIFALVLHTVKVPQITTWSELNEQLFGHIICTVDNDLISNILPGFLISVSFCHLREHFSHRSDWKPGSTVIKPESEQWTGKHG